MFKGIAVAILSTMLIGLFSTLWGFQKQITSNTVKINNNDQKSTLIQESLKDDLNYIRARVDRIHELIKNDK